MTPLLFRARLGLTLILLLVVFTGCAGNSTGATIGKAALTPLTVVRDVVDAPVVTVANSFEYFAEQSHLAKAPTAGVGWSLQGGFNVGVGYDLSYIAFKGLSYIFGGVDYVVCRSLWPNYPNGITPWSKPGYHWGYLYFPNTRVLWGDERPLQNDPEIDAAHQRPD
jgi:hypothetical protein